MLLVFNHELNESGTCPCCGSVTMSITAQCRDHGTWVCDYLIRWTKSAPDHPWAIFLVMETSQGHAGITLEYRTDQDAFMVGDASAIAWPERMLITKPILLERAEVIGHDLAQSVFALLDFIWISDPDVPGRSECSS